MSENYIMMGSEEEIRQAFEKMKADIMTAVSEMFNCAISRIANRDGNVIQYPTEGESPSAFLENSTREIHDAPEEGAEMAKERIRRRVVIDGKQQWITGMTEQEYAENLYRGDERRCESGLSRSEAQFPRVCVRLVRNLFEAECRNGDGTHL